MIKRGKMCSKMFSGKLTKRKVMNDACEGSWENSVFACLPHGLLLCSALHSKPKLKIPFGNSKIIGISYGTYLLAIFLS